MVLLAFLSSIDLGRSLYSYIAITEAAAEGVRVAAIASNSDSVVKSTAVTSVASQITLSANDIGVSPSFRQAGNAVTVTIGYNFDPLTPLISTVFGGRTFRMYATATGVVQS